jgi:hypothetical protein
MSGYDIGASFAASSGAQGGDASTGDINIGGSGGVNKTPWYVWVGLGVLFLVVAIKFLFPTRGRK